MKNFLKEVERNCVSGALLLLPLIVFFVILQKVWGFFQKYGEIFAHLFRLDEILGVIARDVVGGLFLLLLLYFSGYLMRLTFLKKFTDWIDDKLMIFLPGYEKNKKIAEEKLTSKVKKANTNLPVLLKQGEYWLPAHLIEEGTAGNVIVFVPQAPDINQGQIYVVPAESIKRLTGTTLADLDESIKSYGKGILGFK